MKQKFRVLQLIDSLDAGGSERMAVHLANTLSAQIDISALVCTRHSGILEEDILPAVKFECLHKKRTIDFKALMVLRAFIKIHQINTIHAHSSSFFMATLLKLSRPNLKLVWHDHYGFRYKTSFSDNKVLILSSYVFNQVITVNTKLKSWAEKHLNCKNVDYVQNFSIEQDHARSSKKVELKGHSEAFKIIHIANLRPQKDHITALKAIKILVENFLNITYHIVGQYDKKSQYYQEIHNFINEKKLTEFVYIYGSQSDIAGLLKQANLGLMSSVSEGLPLSLLEYAHAKIPIVVTDVGQCKDVVGDFAKVIQPQNERALALGIKTNIENPKSAQKNAKKLFKKISKTYNSEHVIQKIIELYSKL